MAPSAREMLETFLQDLLRSDWEKGDGALRLNPDLTLADLAESPFLINARIFMHALDEQKGAPITETGNLKRSFVETIFQSLSLKPQVRSSIREVNKVINELDLWPLHLVRLVCHCARLIERRNKRFQLTRRGRELLGEDQAGKLFRALFIGYFKQFNLEYNFTWRSVPGIQQTIAIVLWRLEVVAQNWHQVRGLAPEVLLPDVLAQLRQSMIGPPDTEEWILGGYVLNALLDFGLIEAEKENPWFYVADEDKIRITPLWRKFIQFVLPGASGIERWN